MFDLENIENEIPGYKYILELGISLDDPLAGTDDRLCICDTRDECIEEMKKHIASYEEANRKCPDISIEAEPYNITRLGTYIKWHDNAGKSWWWTYGIYPVKYIKNN